MAKSKQNYYEQFPKNNFEQSQKYMERYKEFNSYKTFIYIKYTHAIT